MLTKWDKRWLDLAKHVSEWSKDPSTKVGAVIANDKLFVSQGYNGFPQFTKDDEELYANREVKYDRVVHAEINAILFADRDKLLGATLYTYPFMPCIRCAGVIIQAGIMRVVAPYNDNPRWIESFKKAKDFFEEADISVLLEKPDGTVVTTW